LIALNGFCLSIVLYVRILNQLEGLISHNSFRAQIAKVARGILSTGQATVALLCELDKSFRIFLQNQSFRDETF
jgi:hypothetical protein